MKTLFNHTEHLEAYILDKLSPEDRLIFDAQLLLDREVQDNLHWQKRSYGIVKAHGREQLRTQLKKIEQELFSKSVHKNFVQRILSYF
ncbi:hypothetical protein H8S90_21660 [Olivibacter sp. SDN3]|uniref:hypothetical protein n=1 Tax=Olivibacter sp. SDN3 TaxID=2764720 RepID=UPI001650DFD4|nr:hypothetical protein [Olivibacter sp. SDN3]QNL49312.1 hypothetical protein H8S90_21660 [Olivibacter sp. SDN3]